MPALPSMRALGAAVYVLIGALMLPRAERLSSDKANFVDRKHRATVGG